jgi:hypothetical protein
MPSFSFFMQTKAPFFKGAIEQLMTVFNDYSACFFQAAFPRTPTTACGT